ncbi:MAG: hypothetical protein V1767_01145 [Chloroflexota bacterium]
MQKLHLVTTVPRYRHYITSNGQLESVRDHDEPCEFDIVLKGKTIIVPACKLNPREFELVPYTFKIKDFEESGYIDNSGYKSIILTWYGYKTAPDSLDKIRTEKISFQTWENSKDISIDVEVVERPYPGAKYFRAELTGIWTSSFTLDQVRAFMPVFSTPQEAMF